ncbi:hypothetical protein pdam_00000956 [Pocillopora damicornis]|uniref:Acyltransferase n=3 Tax=Pocillopora damicornis TaxID=46731 RepID=A0A3M6T6C6_POCDA|nr:hypothetical protein pdam_00000956 [Pocillopora damicornis]
MSPSIDYILQYLSIALLYFVGFLGGTHVLGILTLYQIFFYTPLWPVVLLYLSWTYLVEWKTPERGGRDLLINFVRRLSVFKYMRDYYPITLVKTCDLDPQKNYIFGYHPHGAFTEGASIGLNTEACGFSDKFPGIIPHLSVTSAILKALLYRDILMALGVIDVSRHSLEYNLTQKGAGHSVVIVVGGAAEIREMGFDSYALIIKRRKGFMKLALQTGCAPSGLVFLVVTVQFSITQSFEMNRNQMEMIIIFRSDLVPVFGFGQNNIYQVIGGSRSCQFSRFQRWFRSFTSCLGTCFLPKRSPINVVVGSPVPVTKIANPTQEEIDQLHAQYLEALTDLYEKNKDKIGCAGRLRAWRAGKNESETGAESKSRSHSYVFKLETKMASGNPLITLERMLNGRTTLKTQKVTHTNIVCIGTELLNEIQQVMREDKGKAVREAVAAAEAKAHAELKKALQEQKEQMEGERDRALEEARLQAEEQMAEIRYRCEVAEKKRARSALERFQKEKSDALQKAAEEAEKNKQEALKNLTETLARKLRNEAALQRELAVGEALAVARKNAERRRQESIEETKLECERKSAAEASRVARVHQNKVNELNQRIDQLERNLEAENDAKLKVENLFQEMKEDYKRFQNYTRGFHSDFLMK